MVVRFLPTVALAVLVILPLSPKVGAEDWPQFLGPHRDGTSTESISTNILKSGPPKLWSKKVGHGFSGPILSGGHLLLHHREDNMEFLECWDAATGASQWRKAYPTRYVDDFGFDDGPRASPCVQNGRVFGFGAEGRLICLSLTDGRELWQVETMSRFKSDKGFFGLASSPLVSGGLVMVNLGGTGAGVGAFRVETGEIAWKLTDDEAGYASPVMTRIQGSDLALFFTRAGLVGVRRDEGTVAFSRRWRSRQHASVNAASPVIWDGELFLTASYGTGAVLLKLKADRVEEVWSGDESLSAHYATPVLADGYLYGFHGRTESKPDFRCVEWSTGKVAWSMDHFGAGTVVRAGSQLVLLLESGELVMMDANPKAAKELGRAQVLGSGTRSPFALGDGILAARDPRQLVVWKVRE